MNYFLGAGPVHVQSCDLALKVAVDSTTAVAPPGRKDDSAAPFDMNLDDQEAFPALSPMQVKLAPQVPITAKSEEKVVHEMSAADLTPEKLRQSDAKDEFLKQSEDKLANEWVVVSSNDASKTAHTTSMVAVEAFDGQHPRNMFTKKAASKQTRVVSQDASSGIDWSHAGIPTDLIRRLIRGSANAAHRGLHSENKSSPLPVHVMRAQNVGTAKRQSSTPKTPRSQSKSRAIKQPLSMR